MGVSAVLSERRGQSIIITFNRADHANSMTLDMANDLFNVMKPIVTDRSARAVMLRGAGGNFMDGIDMKDMGFAAPDITQALERCNQLILPYHSVVRELQTMDKPVVAVAEGKVCGVGLSLMLASDIIIAGRDATFKLETAEYAITPTGACSYFLPRRVGLTKALEMLMFDEPFGAEEALAMGLVNRVVDNGRLEEEALAVLDRLTEGPTRAYAGIKKLTLKGFENDLNAHLGLEHTYFGQSFRSFDFREVIKAKQAGREAKFSGN